MRPVLLNSGLPAPSTSCDTIKVELRNPSAPYGVASSFKGVLATNGTLNCKFKNAINGNNYYIALQHRNALETWSASTVAISGTSTYDFSTSAAQAYGSNMVSVGGKWCLYSGDIDPLPRDGNIDLDDFPVWQQDYNAEVSGYYKSDLNGSGTPDLDDFPIWQFGYNNEVSVIKPN